MERIDRIEKAIEELVAAQKARDVQIKELIIAIKELRESIGRNSSRIEKLPHSGKSSDIQLNEINKAWEIDTSNAIYAQDFFFSSLKQKMELNGIHFDYIEKNIKGKAGDVVDKFDIVLYNDDTIGLLEVKNNIQSANVKQLLTTKLQNFRTLHPGYADAKIYLGIAGFTFESEAVKAEAKAAGVAVLMVQGGHYEADTESMKAY